MAWQSQRGDMSGLFHSTEFSDLTIKCGGREWPAHKAVLCTRSEYFHRVVTSGFKVRSISVAMLLCTADNCSQESESAVVELRDDDPDVVHLMLGCLYRGTIELSPFRDPSTLPELCMSLFVLADKYLLHDLEKPMIEEFKCKIQRLPTESFARVVNTVYDMEGEASEPVRKAVVDVVTYVPPSAAERWTRRHAQDTAPGWSVPPGYSLGRVLRQAPKEFAVEVAERLRKALEDAKR
ncbi:uncharacterized protein LTR77_008979 [Saxophila tyrrhenica]|uniref:BTB domain-containing protein n=1 Tax=Saxophila tyrrhenica TaxID=1690608 RepID=A0AAV9P054_9PEZI|nr:hypothetical protein LTR77_008979 [Saxophila tyrrhenica]